VGWFLCSLVRDRSGPAISQLVKKGYVAFVEVSPHPVLVESVQDTAQAMGSPSATVSTLRRNDGGLTRLLTSMAELYTHGIEVDWEPFFGDASWVELPTYVFQRERYWLDDTSLPEPFDPPSGKAPWDNQKSPSGQDPVGSGDLRNLVRDECAVVLGFHEPDRTALDRPFKELGFDSAMLVELVSRLNTAAKLTLTSNILFDHPTPTRLAAFLQSQAKGQTDITKPRPVPTTALEHEPIAIIGMACRYPGGIDTPERLWNLVHNGVDAISAMPTGRGWSERSLFAGPGGGGFLNEAGDFDAGFLVFRHEKR
jgi:acyl transferase domain-containing protein